MMHLTPARIAAVLIAYVVAMIARPFYKGWMWWRREQFKRNPYVPDWFADDDLVSMLQTAIHVCGDFVRSAYTNHQLTESTYMIGGRTTFTTPMMESIEARRPCPGYLPRAAYFNQLYVAVYTNREKFRGRGWHLGTDEFGCLRIQVTGAIEARDPSTRKRATIVHFPLGRRQNQQCTNTSQMPPSGT